MDNNGVSPYEPMVVPNTPITFLPSLDDQLDSLETTLPNLVTGDLNIDVIVNNRLSQLYLNVKNADHFEFLSSKNVEKVQIRKQVWIIFPLETSRSNLLKLCTEKLQITSPFHRTYTKQRRIRSTNQNVISIARRVNQKHLSSKLRLKKV